MLRVFQMNHFGKFAEMCTHGADVFSGNNNLRVLKFAIAVIKLMSLHMYLLLTHVFSLSLARLFAFFSVWHWQFTIGSEIESRDWRIVAHTHTIQYGVLVCTVCVRRSLFRYIALSTCAFRQSR